MQKYDEESVYPYILFKDFGVSNLIDIKDNEPSKEIQDLKEGISKRDKEIQELREENHRLRAYIAAGNLYEQFKHADFAE